MCFSKTALFMMLTLLPLSASAEWLEFGAGCPDQTPPAIRFNDTWDGHLTFDVELTGLSVDTITASHEDYLRFNDSPGSVPMDSIGWPELPVIRRMVWLPDHSDISLECSANCSERLVCLQVYPAPLDSLVADSTTTPYIGEFFVKDSTAYASTEWFQDTLVRFAGEFRLRDLRVGVVDVYPLQYLASEDSLRVWSDIEIRIGWDESEADWSEAGLGYYDNLIGDNLLGYTPHPIPINDGDGSVVRLDWDELEDGPGYAADYVILVASGLDGQTVTDLAGHRDELNGFDVVIVGTDAVLECYGGQQTVLTCEMIRDFTDDMWEWGTGPGDRPTYFLLIGDHEDALYASEDWFLPTRTTDPDNYGNRMGSDGWYVGFDEPRQDFSVFPDMAVGRLPARTSAQLGDMVDLIIDYESEVTSWPPPSSLSWRRFLSRLSGTNHLKEYVTYDPWSPRFPWMSSLSNWLGYSLDNYYCGDGESPDEPDGSLLTSAEWVQHCRDVFSRGSQVVLYSNHGAMHMFSGGLNWVGVANFGIPDSSFDCFDVADLPYNLDHGWPFILMLCCSAGTFNETQAEHDYVAPGEHACFDFASRPAPGYDFGTTSLSEAFLLNTSGGGIGVFASSLSSSVWLFYARYGQGFLEAFSKRGLTRIGDAMQACRLEMMPLFGSPGNWHASLGQHNLLGDPAVDIGERVKFRHRCDLAVVPEELSINQYATLPAGQSTGVGKLFCIVNNFGAVSSSACTASMEVTCGAYHTTLTASCPAIDPGDQSTVRFNWQIPSSLTPPLTLTLHATADIHGNCSDSWSGNNDATADVEVLDFYPNDDDWPCVLPGSVQSPPCLADVDGDGDLEIAALSGTSSLHVYEPDGSLIWRVQTPAVVNQGSACEVFAAGNVCGTSAPEIVVDCLDQLCVYDGSDGELLYTFSHDAPGFNWNNPHPVTLADVVTEVAPENPQDEIAFICNGNLYLLRVQNHELVRLDREGLPSGLGDASQGWIAAADLDGSTPVELVISMTDATSPMIDPISFIGLYRYQNGQGSYYSTSMWQDENSRMIPAIGSLAGLTGTRIAVSRRTSSASHAPAFILDPLNLSSTPIDCQHTGTPSSQILCCMMTDWQSGLTGLDRVLAPAENQCFAWETDGNVDWYDLYSVPDSYQPPFGALGNLDDDDVSDLLVGTRSGVVQAYNFEGNPMSALGFPYTLPAQVTGGYCIADIDFDGKIEVVFGTMDNYLHIWELGSCTAGYAPWPQVQHDAARTGALE